MLPPVGGLSVFPCACLASHVYLDYYMPDLLIRHMVLVLLLIALSKYGGPSNAASKATVWYHVLYTKEGQCYVISLTPAYRTCLQNTLHVPESEDRIVLVV